MYRRQGKGNRRWKADEFLQSMLQKSNPTNIRRTLNARGAQTSKTRSIASTAT